jgi:hypothetical protein
MSNNKIILDEETDNELRNATPVTQTQPLTVEVKSRLPNPALNSPAFYANASEERITSAVEKIKLANEQAQEFVKNFTKAYDPILTAEYLKTINNNELRHYLDLVLDEIKARTGEELGK